MPDPCPFCGGHEHEPVRVTQGGVSVPVCCGGCYRRWLDLESRPARIGGLTRGSREWALETPEAENG